MSKVATAMVAPAVEAEADDLPWFEVDGVRYELTFRIGQQKAFQRATGESAVAALVSMETSPGDMVRLSALFQYGLTPTLSEEDTDALIDKIGLASAIKRITAASQEAFKGLMNPPTEPPAN